MKRITLMVHQTAERRGSPTPRPEGLAWNRGGPAGLGAAALEAAAMGTPPRNHAEAQNPLAESSDLSRILLITRVMVGVDGGMR